jgi:D-beta-D-heptose 7-phosphate kinase/D-beta-D-heptose 1-phosphate adenosyltransferase
MNPLVEHVRSLAGKKVVVVGDLMLDEHVRGEVLRISPEAPVPVLEVKEREHSPGGAANAAANVRSLGGLALVVGVVGADAQADTLRDLMKARGLDVTGFVVDDTRPTTHKSRLVARGQQIVRLDNESRHPLSAAVHEKLVAQIESHVAGADAVVLSDYAKGVITPEVCAAAVRAARARGCPIIVDPKRRDLSAYAGATVVTPNLHELELAANTSCTTESEIVQAGEKLLPILDGAALLVTRGAAGMTLFRTGKPPYHLPTKALSVFDVTGAGDTVVGALALSLAAKIQFETALDLASHAAAVAVSKLGTHAVTADELVEALNAR